MDLTFNGLERLAGAASQLVGAGTRAALGIDGVILLEVMAS